MKILADENIPLVIVEKLRGIGIDVISISQTDHGINDRKIIEIARDNKSIILTFDKDFGELIFKNKLFVEGIILLRFPPVSVDYIFSKIQRILSILKNETNPKIIVIDENKIRIRNLKF